ncbi:MAG TPA: hypothetical protein VM074_10565 [Solimonas sp.]|nr:hypothetical protein [Solimonas sp.]
MIATLGPRYYAILLVALLLLAMASCAALLRRPSRRRLGTLALATVLFGAASWPELGGRLLFRARCSLHAGLALPMPLDARDSGYLLPSPQPPWGRFDYFRHGVLDLLQGRVRFFEVEESSGRYIRYALAGVHSPRCIAPQLAQERLRGLDLPRGRCLTAREAPTPASRYELLGYAGPPRRLPREVSIRERRPGAEPGPALAAFRWFRHVAPFAGEETCPVDAAHNAWHPLWNLTSFALMDEHGAVVREADLPALAREQAAAGADAPAPEQQLIPGEAAWQAELTGQGLLPERCDPPLLPDDTRVVSVSARHGGAQIEVRLDPDADHADFVILDVNLIGSPVAVIADAELPTLWHVHVGRDSQLVAFVVRGRGGQGVEGLDAAVALRMSTERYNPRSQCSAAELAAIAQELSRRYPAQPADLVEPLSADRSLHFGIGETMRDGQQLFTYEVPRAEFELEAEGDAEPAR